MSKFNAGQSFANGDTVTGPTLNNITGLLDIYTGLISEQTAMSATVSTADQLLIADTDNGDSGAANRITVQKLFSDSLTNGTFASANLTGTITSNRTVATSATITTGTIPTLVSNNATIGTTTGTAGVFTSGTIDTLNSTTPTFLGAITASTNTINVGSGQIYKDATGNVGIGTVSPVQALSVVGGIDTNFVSSITSKVSSGAYMGFLDTTTTDRPLLGAVGNNLVIRTGTAERLRINSSGNVGIGNTSPQAALDLGDGTGGKAITWSGTAGTARYNSIFSSFSGAALVLASGFHGSTSADSYISSFTGTQGLAGIRFDSFGGDAGEIKFFTNGTAVRTAGAAVVPTERMSINSTGGVTIVGLAGTGSRAVNASAAGLLSAASDASLKEEVVGAHIAGLAEILQIHPKMYRWKDDIANRGDNASIELGFIANDVAPIIPSAAPLGNDGLYGFYDRSITAALVKAVQELKSENDSLKLRIEALEAK
jgi:hypothetical protein